MQISQILISAELTVQPESIQGVAETSSPNSAVTDISDVGLCSPQCVVAVQRDSYIRANTSFLK